MAWWMLASAALQVYQGYQSQQQNSSNALVSRQYASWNAQQTWAMANWKASSLQNVAIFNARAAMSAASAQAGAIMNVAKYNAAIEEVVAQYNTQKYEQEAADIWKAEELDEKLLDQQVAKLKGDQTAAFAASNVITGQDSHEQLMLDQDIQAELEKEVMRWNADISAKNLLNAAMEGEWQAELAGNQMIAEASAQAAGIAASANANAVSMVAQSMLDANLIRYNGFVDAQRTIFEGTTAANNFTRQGQNNLWAGMINAGSTVANHYQNNSLSTTYGSGGLSNNPSAIRSTPAPTVANNASQRASQMGNVTRAGSNYEGLLQ